MPFTLQSKRKSTQLVCAAAARRLARNITIFAHFSARVLNCKAPRSRLLNQDITQSSPGRINFNGGERFSHSGAGICENNVRATDIGRNATVVCCVRETQTLRGKA